MRHRQRKPAPAPAGPNTQATEKNKSGRAVLVLSALLLTLLPALCGVLTLALPAKAYSENENRVLASAPRLSLTALLEGKWMRDAEEYLSDHFFARDLSVRAHTCLAVLFGQKEINDVYIGKSHFLFEKTAALSPERLSAALDTVNGVAAEYGDARAYFALAPNASEVLPELLPDNAPRYDQGEQILTVYGGLKNVIPVDLLTPLREAPDRESLYYRTDHHWTTEAAAAASRQIVSAMGIDVSGAETVFYPVSNGFQGTLASSAGLFTAQDTVSIPVPSPAVSYVVDYTEEKVKRPSLYETEKLSQKNRYEVFFGGNHALVRIETDSDSDRTLLLIKDSYANCLAPMLLPYFKTVVMVDPRYFQGSLISAAPPEEITDILWLYNVNTFLTDVSIPRLTSPEELPPPRTPSTETRFRQ